VKRLAQSRWLWAGLAVAAVVATASLARAPLAGPPSASAPVKRSASEIARCIRDPRCRETLVVAHRGEGFGGVENSRAAVQSAVDSGVPVVEIDLRGSRDGELFVLHDGKLENATTLRGRVEEASSTAIAGAKLRNGETVPRFEDVYAITRGRIVLSVDFKVPAEAMERTADWIHAHGSFDDLIFFANTGEEIAAAARAKQRYPEMIAMVRLLDTRVTVASTRAAFGGRLPDIFHTNRLGAEEVASLHALGVKVYMNALPLDRYYQPFRYFAIRSLLRTGVDLVLTSEPEAMMRWIAAEHPAR
jgi:glycerophosphoryl diester phosphodiesterase